MKYLLTVLDTNMDGGDVAIDVLYCGRDFWKMRSALDAARENKQLIGKRLRVLKSTDDGEVVEQRDTVVY